MKSALSFCFLAVVIPTLLQAQWKQLSSPSALALPNAGKEQTSATVFDIDKDGRNDFVITERTAAPAAVWYRRTDSGWERFIIEPGLLHIEAGATFFDVDGDGDLDFIAGGDWQSNEVWWWENPYPNFPSDGGWKRHLIKNSLKPKHHDLGNGDFLKTGKPQLIFWNQDSHQLILASTPPDPRHAGPWALEPIYSYSIDSQPEQRGLAASFKGINEHEGLAVGDVDGDGQLDIVAGGHWFRNLGDDHFEANVIDAGNAFSRAAVGHLLTGEKTEQVVFVIGDGEGPLIWYCLVKGTWIPHKIADIHFGHSLQLADIDGDGNLDIFVGEQRLNCGNEDARLLIFLGDGKGHFTSQVAAIGLDSHESKVADLDGNGTLDLLVKPYNCGTPGLQIFLNQPDAIRH